MGEGVGVAHRDVVTADEVGHLLHGVAVVAHRGDRALGPGGGAGEEVRERGSGRESLGARELGTAPRRGTEIIASAYENRIAEGGLRLEPGEGHLVLAEPRFHEPHVRRCSPGSAGGPGESPHPVDGQEARNRVLAGRRPDAAPAPIARV